MQYLNIGPIYTDHSTWPKGPYGFEENLSQSTDIYKRGLKKLIEKAIRLYSVNEGNHKLLTHKILENIKWQNHVNPVFLEATLTLIRDMRLLCKKPRIKDIKYSEWSKNQSLEVLQKNRKYPKISSSVIEELRRWIMLLDKSYYELSMEKKPDHYAVITLREDILQASCMPLRVIGVWYKAINYLEYLAEKNTYIKGMPADILENKTRQNLENDKHYEKILHQFFLRSFPSTNEVNSKIKLSWKNFLIQQDMKSLNNYCEAMLDRCRVSGPDDCRIVYHSLYKLKFKNVNSNPVYLYSLAEAAFRSKEYNIAENLIKDVLTLKKIDPLYKKQAERLMNTLSIYE